MNQKTNYHLCFVVTQAEVSYYQFPSDTIIKASVGLLLLGKLIDK